VIPRISYEAPGFTVTARKFDFKSFSDILINRKGGDDKCAAITRISMNTSMSIRK
jgi:hypothetical protein